MSETKRVSDQYKITAPEIILDGNLTVIGSTTSVETTNSAITDNIIILNDGEGDAFGITAGSAGIQIARGGEDAATILFQEATDGFEFKTGVNFATVRGADPVDGNDLATKDYVDASGASSLPGGPLTSIQFNSGPVFGGTNDLRWNGSTLSVQDIDITVGSISVSISNSDLEISANGNGKLFLRSTLRLEDQIIDPTDEAGSNVVYAKTPGNAGSGVYFTNATATDELVSRSKAILYGLIF